MPYYTGSRQAERDLSALKSRGARRRVRAEWKARRDAEQAEDRQRRTLRRVQQTAMREHLQPKAERTIIHIPSWKQISRIAAPETDLWFRGRIILKRFEHKPRSCLHGELVANANRADAVSEGALVRVGDDKDEKRVRYVRPGLLRKLMAYQQHERDRAEQIRALAAEAKKARKAAKKGK